MKVIGKTQEDSGDYIAIVSHIELEKLFDKYYGNLPRMKVGDAVDLGAGYNFRRDIKSVCEKMESATKAFHDAQATMLKFAVMVGQLPDEEKPGGGA